MVVEYAFATGPSALEELYRDPLNYINREDMATLQEGNQVVSNIIDSYAYILNMENKRRNPDAKNRFFCTTECWQILCGEGYFKKSKNTYDERYIAFKARLSDEMKNSKITTFDKVNLVFFPVPTYYHYYLFCINFTKKILEVIDNRKLQRHISFKSKYEDFPQTFLKAFAQFLNETQAGNGNSVKEFKIVTKQMPWRNNDNITDCGVYALKHMESYEGQDDCKIGVNKKESKMTGLSVRPTATEQPTSLRTPMGARPSFSAKNNEHPLPRPSSAGRLSQTSINTQEPKQSSTPLVTAVKASRSSMDSIDMVEEQNALSGRVSLSVRTNGEPSAHSLVSVNSEEHNLPERSSMAINPSEQPPSARSILTSRPSGIKSVTMMPPAVKTSMKQPTLSSPMAGSVSSRRLSLDFGSMISREPKEPNDQLSSTALQDELDMLQEENDSLLDKLRIAEERFQDSEARAKQLEKQVANLGEGVTMEARLLNRKEAALQQREAALRVASQKYGGKTGDVVALRIEAETARDEAISALDQLQESESELRSLRSMVHRLMLTQEEMEEVVLKRCWLARYWGLCVRYGIYPDIAEAKLEYWSSFAPLPVEIVIAAGQKAKEDNHSANNDEKREKTICEANELSGEGSAESMLMVERGLRELSVLKVEDAIRVAMAQHRRRNMKKPAFTDDSRSPSLKFAEAFDLSQEETEEVQFKQAWLMYFWRRARNHGLEPDIADERLHFWINQSARASSSHDAVDVERGLMELRKLGMENQLWEESRRWTEQDSQTRRQTDF